MGQDQSSPRSLIAEDPVVRQEPAPETLENYIQQNGGLGYFKIGTETRSDDNRLYRRVQVGGDSGGVPEGVDPADWGAMQEAAAAAGYSGDTASGEWEWVIDPIAEDLWRASGQPDLFDIDDTSKSAAAYAESDPSKQAQSAFDAYMKRAKGYYDLLDSEADRTVKGNKYNMDMMSDMREVGGWGFNDVYVGSPASLRLSQIAQPMVDEGPDDSDFYALASGGVKGYAAGTMMPQPGMSAQMLGPDMSGVPPKLRPLIGRGSIYVGPPRVQGIPTGVVEPSRRQR